MALDILVNKDSGNGLSPILHWAITWINADLLTVGSWWKNFGETFINIFIQESAFENVSCKKAAMMALWTHMTI